MVVWQRPMGLRQAKLRDSAKSGRSFLCWAVAKDII